MIENEISLDKSEQAAVHIATADQPSEQTDNYNFPDSQVYTPDDGEHLCFWLTLANNAEQSSSSPSLTC